MKDPWKILRSSREAPEKLIQKDLRLCDSTRIPSQTYRCLRWVTWFGSCIRIDNSGSLFSPLHVASGYTLDFTSVGIWTLDRLVLCRR
jgi:hypothetical protein